MSSEVSRDDAERIGRWMEQNDRLARLLGMRLEAVRPGSCRVSMEVTADMLNAVGLTHGGATIPWPTSPSRWLPTATARWRWP
jgi:acyl-coenzyme A thioesterase PaaI-like protein